MSNDDFNKDKVLARVKKMMALANDAGATEGERDNALRMAHATLAKYNLSMAEADAAGTKPEEKRTNDQAVSKDFPWMRSVAHAIATLFFCEYFFMRMNGGKVRHYFIGKESNVFTAKEMMFYVINSIDKEAQRMSREVTGSTSGNYWRSFCKGAAARVYRRCEEIRANAEGAVKTPGTALVLASVYQIEQKANAEYMADKMGLGEGDIKMERARQRNTSYDAHRAGTQFGDRVSLNTQIGGNSTNKPRLK